MSALPVSLDGIPDVDKIDLWLALWEVIVTTRMIARWRERCERTADPFVCIFCQQMLRRKWARLELQIGEAEWLLDEAK